MSARAARVLVVEDEAHLAEVVSDNLEIEGYEVEVVDHGERALETIRQARHDLVLLDVMLPGIDGFTICETARAEGIKTPVLFLTAKGSTDDRVRGLEAGGDDYLAKPFDLQELILRVAAILRRTEWFQADSPVGDTLVLGDVTLDFRSYSLTRGDRTQQISEKETMILRCLAERAGDVVSRAEILDTVWGYDAFPTSRTVDNFIVRLRRLIEPDARSPRYIHTVRGTGYRLTP